MIIDFLKQAQC